jgi:hypothetical protein
MYGNAHPAHTLAPPWITQLVALQHMQEVITHNLGRTRDDLTAVAVCSMVDICIFWLLVSVRSGSAGRPNRRLPAS